jgi:hypothetical protein
MAQFRKKPVVIEAIQFLGVESLVDFALDWGFAPAFELQTDTLRIETLEGEMRANIGDWIIRGVKGEYYPCKPDIFTVTYEPANG